jgi:hypothetical protein
MTRTGELSRNQKRALVALLNSPSVTAAAKRCGLARSTVHNYLADPLFKSELRRRQSNILAGTGANLVGASESVANRLLQVILSPNASTTDVLRAIAIYRDWLMKTVDQDVILERLDGIEVRLNESADRKTT